jgi:hypothetical protein
VLVPRVVKLAVLGIAVKTIFEVIDRSSNDIEKGDGG